MASENKLCCFHRSWLWMKMNFPFGHPWVLSWEEENLSSQDPSLPHYHAHRVPGHTTPASFKSLLAEWPVFIHGLNQRVWRINKYRELVGRVTWKLYLSPIGFVWRLQSCVYTNSDSCPAVHPVTPTFWNLHPSPWGLQIKLTGIRFCLETRVRGRPDGSGALGCEKHMQTL